LAQDCLVKRKLIKLNKTLVYPIRPHLILLTFFVHYIFTYQQVNTSFRAFDLHKLAGGVITQAEKRNLLKKISFYYCS